MAPTKWPLEIGRRHRVFPTGRPPDARFQRLLVDVREGSKSKLTFQDIVSNSKVDVGNAYVYNLLTFPSLTPKIAIQIPYPIRTNVFQLKLS